MSTETQAAHEPTLAQRYQSVRERIATAAHRAGRSPSDVLLVAVTKFADPTDIRELITLGHRDFGENRVQNMLQRVAMVDEYLSRSRTLSSVDGLAAKGVMFARFGFFVQDARGIWSAPDGTKVAWFHDPDLNLLSVVQPV